MLFYALVNFSIRGVGGVFIRDMSIINIGGMWYKQYIKESGHALVKGSLCGTSSYLYP